MAYIVADNEKEQEYFDFLEELRQEGVTNMWGAAPYLRRAFSEDFGTTRKPNDDPASAVLLKWMKYHADPERVRKV